MNLFINEEWSTLKKLMLAKAASGGSLTEYTETGNPVSFNTNVAKPLKGLSIPFLPVQSGSGDPSPSNVRPVLGWSGASIYYGENYYHYADFPQGTSIENDNWVFLQNLSPIYSSEDNKITFTCYGQGLTMCYRKENHSPGTYTMEYMFDKSGTNTDGLKPRIFVRCFNANGDIIKTSNLISGMEYNTAYQGYWQNGLGKFTVPNTVDHFWIGFGVGLDTSGQTVSFANISLGNDQSATTIPITFPASAGTVYGGYIDCITGAVVTKWENIASYNGETLPGKWLSDRDVYSSGATPTTGAQVVYELAAPVVAATIDPISLQTLIGQNVVWSDTNGTNTIKYMKKG